MNDSQFADACQTSNRSASVHSHYQACLWVRAFDRTTLERLVADGKTLQRIDVRTRIVLLSGCGVGANAIQREARVSKPTVWR
jgi:hypothetical protein